MNKNCLNPIDDFIASRQKSPSLSQQFFKMKEEFEESFMFDSETGKMKLIYFATDAQTAYYKICKIGARNYNSDEQCIDSILSETTAKEFMQALPFFEGVRK